MAFDAFMVVKVRGAETLQGETTDDEFRKQMASEILSFSFTSFPEATAASETEAIDAGTDTSSSRSSSPPSPTASLKDPSDLAGLIKSIPIIKKSITHIEETHKESVDSLHARIDRVADATNAVAERVNQVDKKVDNLAEEQANGGQEQDLASTGKGKEKAKKANKLGVVLEKFVDTASTRLLKAFCQVADRQAHDDYQPFEQVVLYLRKAGGPRATLYLKIELSQVDVTAYSLNSGSGSEPPKETFTLSCQKFKVEYTPQTTAGTAASKSKSSILDWDFEKIDEM
jgi:type VI protein secretion system component Hcp